MIKISPKALAIDWGRKRIGIAVGESILSIRPLGWLANTSQVASELKTIVERENIKQMIIGAQIDQSFVQKLRDNFKLPIKVVDESFSSLEAKRNLGQPTAPFVDHRAAAMILEQFFIEQENFLSHDQ